MVEKYTLVFGTISETHRNGASRPTGFTAKLLIRSLGARTTDLMMFGCQSITLSKKPAGIKVNVQSRVGMLHALGAKTVFTFLRLELGARLGERYERVSNAVLAYCSDVGCAVRVLAAPLSFRLCVRTRKPIAVEQLASP